MAYRFRPENWTTGDTVTPHELNASIAEVLQEFNGMLDTDNIDANAVTVNKLADLQLNSIINAEVSSNFDVTLLARAGTTGWIPIDFVDEEFTSGDSELYLHFDATAQLTNDPNSGGASPPRIAISFGILLDGQIVAETVDEVVYFTPMAGLGMHITGGCARNVPVAAGPHRVQGAILVQSYDEFNTDDAVIRVQGRSLIIREGKR